jgi:hypothetical protein
LPVRYTEQRTSGHVIHVEIEPDVVAVLPSMAPVRKLLPRGLKGTKPMPQVSREM